MRLSLTDTTPFHSLPHQTSGPKGRTLRNMLPFFRASAPLPAGWRCVVFTADLQAREIAGKGRLLGEAVAEELTSLVHSGAIPPIDLIGLAGDLYDVPECNKRGSSGPVDPVWRAMAAASPRVVGVHGNHDWLEETLPQNAWLLDGDCTSFDGLRLGGVSGIIGNPKRKQRKTAEGFQDALCAVLDRHPNIVFLHQGPDDGDRRGDPDVRELLELGHNGLTVFGHCHWHKNWLIELGEGQALNVDGRVVVVENSQNPSRF